jgi:SET domain-containing protein
MFNRLPHAGVYTRLRPSKVHGVGVFAIRKIKKGTNIFSGDDADVVWIKKSSLRRLPGEIRKLYEDFAVIRNDGTEYGCPKSFNVLTVGWYLNESENPNVRCDKSFDFLALRDIAVGEELTVDYGTYSEPTRIRRERRKYGNRRAHGTGHRPARDLGCSPPKTGRK